MPHPQDLEGFGVEIENYTFKDVSCVPTAGDGAGGGGGSKMEKEKGALLQELLILEKCHSFFLTVLES